jgi:hypothetical protein
MKIINGAVKIESKLDIYLTIVFLMGSDSLPKCSLL